MGIVKKTFLALFFINPEIKGITKDIEACIVKIIIFLDKKKEFSDLAKGGFWAVNGQKK